MSRQDQRKEYWDSRFDIPERLREFKSRYDFTSQELQDLAQRKVKCFRKLVLDLSVAQNVTDPSLITGAGRAFVIFGYTAASEATTKTVAPSVLVNVGVNENNAENQWTAKHNRGFRGDFERLFLSWPAQSGNKAELYIFTFDEQPWQCGEAAT